MPTEIFSPVSWNVHILFFIKRLHHLFLTQRACCEITHRVLLAGYLRVTLKFIGIQGTQMEFPNEEYLIAQAQLSCR